MKNLPRFLFRNKKFDAVICLDANLPSLKYFQKIMKLPILAADGAGIKLLKKGITPDYIIGDLDSFRKNKYSINFSSNSLIQIWDQNKNDFEKTLDFALSKGYRDVLILGFHGGDLEHTLNNWSVFTRFSKILNLVILDKKRYGFSVLKSITIECLKDEMISLIPQPSASITTENLKWNLKDETLNLGTREGARNIALDENISIIIHSGELLVFIDERLPVCPELK